MKIIKKLCVGVICATSICGMCITVMLGVSCLLAYKGKMFDNSMSIWLRQNASVDLKFLSYFNPDSLANKYPASRTKIGKYQIVVEEMEEAVENLCTTSFPNSSFYKDTADAIKEKYLNYNLNNNFSNDERGFEQKSYAQDAFEKVNEFDLYLKDVGIPFVYVQIPGATRISAAVDGKEYPYEELKNADEFAMLMEESSIEFIEISDMVDLQKFGFDESGHWRSEDAIVGTSIICNYLNTTYDFNYDLTHYQTENYHNVLEESSDVVPEIKRRYGYEYNMLVPYEECLYDVQINEEQNLKGLFSESLLTQEEVWTIRLNSGEVLRYNDFIIVANDKVVDIINTSNSNNPDKKILVLGDSFSCLISTYLSEETGEVVAMHPDAFPGSIKAYIDSYEPDAVIMMYYEGQVGLRNNQNYKRLNN